MEGKEVNILTLKLFDDDVILYEYQPEGKGEKGVISYNKKNGDFHIEKPAEEDNNSGYYARMAQSKIANIVDKKSLPMECVQAWY